MTCFGAVCYFFKMSKVPTRIIIVAVLILTALAMTVKASSVEAKTGGTRPGWGYGDKNHEHTGPPGLTVRPNAP